MNIFKYGCSPGRKYSQLFQECRHFIDYNEDFQPTYNPYGEPQTAVGWQKSGRRQHGGKPGWHLVVFLFFFYFSKSFDHLVRHGLLGILPLPAPVDQGDQEEGAPEDEVGHRDHQEHLHPHHPLLLHPRDVLLDVAGRPNIAFLECETQHIL